MEAHCDQMVAVGDVLVGDYLTQMVQAVDQNQDQLVAVVQAVYQDWVLVGDQLVAVVYALAVDQLVVVNCGIGKFVVVDVA